MEFRHIKIGELFWFFDGYGRVLYEKRSSRTAEYAGGGPHEEIKYFKQKQHVTLLRVG